MTTERNHDVTDERHRATCAACRTLWAELDAISAEAAQLSDLAPSRDLWSGIEARLGAPAVVASDDATVAGRIQPRWRATTLVQFAAAAALLVTVTSTVTWKLATERGAPLAFTEQSLPGGDPEASALYLASLNASVSQMDQEIAALQTIVSERRRELDPRTVSVLEANLKVIDAAIAESRAALAADPSSQFLASQFTRAYSSKLTLLRDAATLPTGI